MEIQARKIHKKENFLNKLGISKIHQIVTAFKI
jgi:hypothetical protein